MSAIVKIPLDARDYIEGLFEKTEGFKALLYFMMQKNTAKEEDIDFYLKEALISSIALEIVKADFSKTYMPDDGNKYHGFYMDFENSSIVFEPMVEEDSSCETQK